MKKALFLMTVFLLSFGAVNAQDWEKYKAEDLSFIAYYPQEPKRTVQKVSTAVGELDMHMIMHAPTSGDDNAVYSVIRSDYPKSQFTNADDEYNATVLDGAVEGAVSNVKGKLEFDNKVKFNGYPGRSIKIEIQGGFIYINAYLVENSMFITQVICLTSNDGNKSIDRFLNSFEIIKTK
ncbi:hypothetical protein IMCC3317_03840 [Kordia antarctica]|uniref:Uncharacterized protein n=1 Tax=Kordia antarctica TaxID=1218801 RepID=A0A7L4ZE56_9FLAO|nr:hypothetical protein [Kordia antarctica]QHI35038.1 hypothetical protein IMCC3317_03840 [Kordia antarctica]